MRCLKQYARYDALARMRAAMPPILIVQGIDEIRGLGMW